MLVRKEDNFSLKVFLGGSTYPGGFGNEDGNTISFKSYLRYNFTLANNLLILDSLLDSMMIPYPEVNCSLFNQLQPVAVTITSFDLIHFCIL